VKWLRTLVFCVTGVVWFFWLSHEDSGFSSVRLVAALIAFALGLESLARWTKRRPAKRAIWLLRSVIIGALAGAIVGPIAVLLALVKISLHPPLRLDFDLSTMRLLLGQSLTWIAAGGLFGAAGGFLKLSQKG
jgi:hypothetical protein